MAKALVSMDGDDDMRKAFRSFENKSGDAFERAIKVSAQEIRTAAIRLIMKGSRSGVQYTVGGKTAQRSAPGEPPKTDTGHLVANIDATIDADGGGATVGTNVQYGLYLEVGTSKMAARPWLSPTFEMLKPEIIKRFQNVIAKTAKKAGKKT
jgi:HK97 gp10 family phage protein